MTFLVNLTCIRNKSDQKSFRSYVAHISAFKFYEGKHKVGNSETIEEGVVIIPLHNTPLVGYP